jgi:hypothetical protein
MTHAPSISSSACFSQRQKFYHTFMVSNLEVSVNMEFSGMTYEDRETPKAQNRSGELRYPLNLQDHQNGRWFHPKRWDFMPTRFQSLLDTWADGTKVTLKVAVCPHIRLCVYLWCTGFCRLACGAVLSGRNVLTFQNNYASSKTMTMACSKVLWKVGVFIPDYTESRPGKQDPSKSLQWEPQILFIICLTTQWIAGCWCTASKGMMVTE